MTECDKKYVNVWYIIEKIINGKDVLQINYDSTTDKLYSTEKPEFQRNIVWNDDMKRAFILSILNNFPTNEIVINIRRNVIRILDGQHRILTINDFIKNRLYIKINKELVFYTEIPESIKQNRMIKSRIITACEKHTFDNYNIALCEYKNLKIEEEKKIFTCMSFHIENDDFFSSIKSVSDYIDKYDYIDITYRRASVLGITYVVNYLMDEYNSCIVDEDMISDLDNCVTLSEIENIDENKNDLNLYQQKYKRILPCHLNQISELIESDRTPEFDSVLNISKDYINFLYNDIVKLNDYSNIHNGYHMWAVWYSFYDEFNNREKYEIEQINYIDIINTSREKKSLASMCRYIIRRLYKLHKLYELQQLQKNIKNTKNTKKIHFFETH